MLEELFETQAEICRPVDLSFKRYLYREINWKNRLIVITGSRGVGKTTLMLQYYRENFSTPEECLYISADSIVVSGIGIYNIAREFYHNGGRTLMIDEIHKYENWSGEIKNIYDSFPSLSLIVSGSSTLDIIKGQYDLSRRAVTYVLRGLSFREFINLSTGAELRPYRLNRILKEHNSIALEVKEQVEARGRKILGLFREYLKRGYYPYFTEGRNEYHMKLGNALEKVIYEDIPSVFGIKPSYVVNLKKLIYLVATSAPFKPNIARISSGLGVSKEYIYNYMDYLEKAGIFMFLHSPVKGFKLVRKPEKVYLENTNLYYAIERIKRLSVDKGALRETFVLNQLKGGHNVYSHDRADMLVDGSIVLEIGGRSKRTGIGSGKNQFVLSDNIETGYSDRIPLYLMGFLY